MTVETILNSGGSILLSIAGTTFDCINTNKQRQDVLKKLQTKMKVCGDKKIMLMFVKELNNEFDPDAVRVDLESGVDIGYIPKKTLVHCNLPGEEIAPSFVASGVNISIKSVGNLKGEVVRVVGGGDYSFGVKIKIWKKVLKNEKN